jgi:sigma-B regulation protein RsbQ
VRADDVLDLARRILRQLEGEEAYQRGELSSIQCPTLIVRGSHDNFVPEYCALELHRLIAGSELVCLNGCGHLPYLEDPALFNRIVEQFIGRK